MMKTNRDLNTLKSNYLKWLAFIETVELVLKDSGYTKILTPYLVSSGAMESQLEPFLTQQKMGHKAIPLQLPTSPEFRLKEALSAGFGDIFEIKTCFRNEESSSCHRAEFQMLEFYKTQVDLLEFMNLVVEIIDRIGSQFHSILDVSLSSKTSVLDLKKNDHQLNLKPNFFKKEDVRFIKISDLFMELGFPLKPNTTLNEFRHFATQFGVEYLDSDSADDIYFRIWLERIEPNFDPKKMFIVHSYPPSQAALSKINEEGWASRFEIYWGGFEIGNAFYELADSKAVEKRWISENQVRVGQGKPPHVIDHKFLTCLDKLPECCGIAIGLERLFMAFSGYQDISEFKFFDEDYKK